MTGYLTIQTPGLPATVATALKFTTRASYGSDGEFDCSVVESAVLTGAHDEGTIRAAITVCEEQCRPGGARVAGEALTILERKTISQKQGEADQNMRGAAYAADLAQYPADIIRAACKRWADSSRWWPAWADLKRECDRLAAKRKAEHRALLAALQRMTTPARPAIEAPKVGATAADRVRDLIAYRKGKGDPRGAALEEQWLARHQGREVEAWARPLLAEISAEEERRRQEFAALAADGAAPRVSDGAPPPRSDALAELAQKARDRIMGIDRTEAA